MAIVKSGDARIGKRVEIPPHYDLWMMGARYGVVEAVPDERYPRERLALISDHPRVKRLVKVFADEVTYR